MIPLSHSKWSMVMALRIGRVLLVSFGVLALSFPAFAAKETHVTVTHIKKDNGPAHTLGASEPQQKWTKEDIHLMCASRWENNVNAFNACVKRNQIKLGH